MEKSREYKCDLKYTICICHVKEFIFNKFNNMIYDSIYHCFVNFNYSATGSTKSMGKKIPASRGHSDSNRFSQRPIPINYI